jgi:N-acyl homoserine lactone hydrolase
VEQVEGDRDVFGDGAVTLISTPGHTSGHQSLLVNLEQTGWVVLAGDATQVKEQWDRWHASPGSYPERLAPSMARLADVVSEHQAQVWFSHDPVQTTELRSASPYYE